MVTSLVWVGYHQAFVQTPWGIADIGSLGALPPGSSGVQGQSPWSGDLEGFALPPKKAESPSLHK